MAVDRKKIHKTVEVVMKESGYGSPGWISEAKNLIDKYLDKKPDVNYKETTLGALAVYVLQSDIMGVGRTQKDLYDILGVRTLPKIHEAYKDILKTLDLKPWQKLQGDAVKSLNGSLKTEEGRRRILERVYEILDEEVALTHHELVDKLGLPNCNPKVRSLLTDFLLEECKKGNLNAKGASYLVFYKKK